MNFIFLSVVLTSTLTAHSLLATFELVDMMVCSLDLI